MLMMKRLLAALAIANMGVTCGPGNSGPPDPDSCDVPQTRTLAGVEIGGADDVFTPFVDDQVVTLTLGPQGGAMLPMRLRITGTSLPDCLAQSTTIRVGAEVIATSELPLKTYVEADGSRTTKANYVVLYYEPADGTELTVTTMAGGQSTTRSLYLNEVGVMPDAAVPPPPADAAD